MASYIASLHTKNGSYLWSLRAKHTKLSFLIWLSFLSVTRVLCQEVVRPQFNVSGFMDVYFVYDFHKPTGANRQPFLYNHNRHQEFNLNLGLIKMGITHPKYRANLAFHAGTYSNDNYVNEPDQLKNIFEANVGLSLDQSKNIWLDVGIFPSHIGFESAIASENWTMTRSLLAENSPYFLTGLKLTLKPNPNLEISGSVLNGWQRIQRLEGNTLPSFGTQLRYQVEQKVILNWSTFLGTDDPDSLRRIRYFNNFYGQFSLSENLAVIFGLDVGVQQKSRNSKAYQNWISPIFISQYKFNERFQIAFRAEYYNDSNGVIVPTDIIPGFSVSGISLNLDFRPFENIMCRLEGRSMYSEKNIFLSSTGFSNHNYIIASSINISFGNQIKDSN